MTDTDPVTVFMLVVAGVLVVGAVGEQVFARTGVPSVIWLVALGVLVRVADIVPAPVIALLAPFFAALALVIILFDAGTNLTGGSGEAALGPATRKRAQLLAFIGFTVSVLLVALFSWGLAGLGILKHWSWAHAFMLGSLVACGASEVVLPSLTALPAVDEATALLRRESAITKALAVTGTVICLDLLSPRVGEGGAALAMAAGFGFALAFGSVAGMLWVVALQRLAGAPQGTTDIDARNYGFTLAAMVVLHVLSEAAGGSGPLSVLVFGAVLGNAEGILRMFGRGAGETGTAVQTALGGHTRTIEFVRTLIFVMVGATLAPPPGPIVMGVALAFLLLVVRLAVARFTLAALEHRERSVVGVCAPRGMATVALVTLPLAHAVPGATEMVALVFSAVTISVLLFTLGLHGLRPRARVVTPVERLPASSLGSQVAADVAASHSRLAVVELPGPPIAREPSGPPIATGAARAPLLPRDPDEQANRPRERSAPQTRVPRERSAPRPAAAEEAPTLALDLAGREARREEVHPTRQHEPEGYMHTLLQLDPAPGAAPSDPLATSMARALAKRPDGVAQVSRRWSSGDGEVPPTFTPFPGSTEEEALSLIAGLGMHDNEPDGPDEPDEPDGPDEPDEPGEPGEPGEPETGRGS